MLRQPRFACLISSEILSHPLITSHLSLHPLEFTFLTHIFVKWFDNSGDCVCSPCASLIGSTQYPAGWLLRGFTAPGWDSFVSDPMSLCSLIPPCFYCFISQFIKFIVYGVESSDLVQPLEFMGASFDATSCAKVNNKTFKNACHSVVLGELCWQPASSPVIWLSALPCVILISLNCSLPMYSFSVHLYCNCDDIVAYFSFGHLFSRKKNVLGYSGCGSQLTHFFFYLKTHKAWHLNKSGSDS